MSVDTNRVCMAHCALLLAFTEQSHLGWLQGLLACTELSHLGWLQGLLACTELSHLGWLHSDGLLTGQTFNGANSLMQNETDLHIGI